MLVRIAATTLLCLAAAAAWADQPPGVAARTTLSVGLSTSNLALELRVPEAALPGETAAAKARLSDPSLLFTLPEAAGCEQNTMQVKRASVQARSKRIEAGRTIEQLSQHAEYRATYNLLCRATGAIDRIGLPLFERLPTIEAIDVASPPNGAARVVTRGQGGFTLRD